MTIHIVMTSYVPEGENAKHPRAQYAVQAITSLLVNLEASEPIRFILANDGPLDQPHVGVIRAMFGDFMWPLTVTGGPRVGIGGSLNRALAEVGPDDLWMYTTDDWILADRLDLSPAVGLIRQLNYHYIKLGPTHPNLACTIKYEQGHQYWLHLHHLAGDGFYFATRPFLAHKRFYDSVGPFVEQVDAYVSERAYSDRVNVNPSLKLGQVVEYGLVGPWEHIGEFEVGDRFP